MFVEFVDVARDAGALAFEVVLDRARETRMRQPVRRVRFHRQQAAEQLVLPLRAALEEARAVGDGEFDRLVVAALEVEQRDVLLRSPVPPEYLVSAE